MLWTNKLSRWFAGFVKIITRKTECKNICKHSWLAYNLNFWLRVITPSLGILSPYFINFKEPNLFRSDGPSLVNAVNINLEIFCTIMHTNRLLKAIYNQKKAISICYTWIHKKVLFLLQGVKVINSNLHFQVAGHSTPGQKQPPVRIWQISRRWGFRPRRTETSQG